MAESSSVKTQPSGLIITPEPSARGSGAGRGGTPPRPNLSPKNSWKSGSSINENCCGVWTRRAEWIVTTAGAAPLAIDAEETTVESLGELGISRSVAASASAVLAGVGDFDYFITLYCPTLIASSTV